MPAAAAHNIALVDRRTAPSSAPRTMDQAKSKPHVMPSIHVIGEAKLRLSTNVSNTSRSGQTTRPARTINATGAKVRRRFCMVGRAAFFLSDRRQRMLGALAKDVKETRR